MTVFNYLPHTEKIEYLASMRDLGGPEGQLTYLDNLLKAKQGDPKAQEYMLKKNTSSTAYGGISKSEPFQLYYRTLLSETDFGKGIDRSNITWTKNTIPRLHPAKAQSLNRIEMVMDLNDVGSTEQAFAETVADIIKR